VVSLTKNPNFWILKHVLPKKIYREFVWQPIASESLFLYLQAWLYEAKKNSDLLANRIFQKFQTRIICMTKSKMIARQSCNILHTHIFPIEIIIKRG
jgi:hypothetical protein